VLPSALPASFVAGLTQKLHPEHYLLHFVSPLQRRGDFFMGIDMAFTSTPLHGMVAWIARDWYSKQLPPGQRDQASGGIEA
jgi:hypothetical protein